MVFFSYMIFFIDIKESIAYIADMAARYTTHLIEQKRGNLKPWIATPSRFGLSVCPLSLGGEGWGEGTGLAMTSLREGAADAAIQSIATTSINKPPTRQPTAIRRQTWQPYPKKTR